MTCLKKAPTSCRSSSQLHLVGLRPDVVRAHFCGRSLIMGSANSTERDARYATLAIPLQSKEWRLLGFSTNTTKCEASPPAPPPLPPNGGDTSSSPPPPPSEEDDSIAKAAASATAFSNPGSYEQAVSDGKRLVMLDTFDGFRCDINKQVSPYMAVIHNFWLGTNMIPDGRKSTYTFLTQVADEQGLLMARIDPARGSVDGRVHRSVLHGLATAKLQIGVSADGQGDQALAELDFGGQTWTGNLKYGSMGGGLVYGCNYLQAITPKLIMGGEGMYIAANQSLISNYALKYSIPAKTGEEDAQLPSAKASAQYPGMPPPETEGSSTICANYSGAQHVLTLNYKRVVTPNRVTLGAELHFSPLNPLGGSEVLVGAEFKLQRSKISLCVDGSGRIQSLLETRLGMAQGSPSLQFSADVDHLKDEMRFGYGINIQG